MDAEKALRAKNRDPLRGSKALRKAIRKRGKAPGSIGFFYSAKNEIDVVATSDLELARGLLLEADESVRSWDSDPDRVMALVENEGYIGTKPDVIITYWSGAVHYQEVKYTDQQGEVRAVMQAETQQRAAELVGATWSWFSEKDVEAKLRLLHDWILIAPILHETTDAVKSRWEWLRKLVSSTISSPTTLGALRERAADAPWALVFSATFRLVHKGYLRTNLADQPLSPDTVIARRSVRSGK